MKTHVRVWPHLAQFFLELVISETKSVEEIRTHILYSINFFRKSCRQWDNVEKYCRAGQLQMTIWLMCIACWIPNATDTHSEYVVFIAFSTATMVTGKRLNVTLYVHCLSCYSVVRSLTTRDARNEIIMEKLYILPYLSSFDPNQETKLSIKL